MSDFWSVTLCQFVVLEIVTRHFVKSLTSSLSYSGPKSQEKIWCFAQWKRRMYRKSEEVNLTRRETTWWTEAFTLHDHDCGRSGLKHHTSGTQMNTNNKKRSHTQLDSRKQVIAFQDRVITINIKEAQHPLK